MRSYAIVNPSRAGLGRAALRRRRLQGLAPATADRPPARSSRGGSEVAALLGGQRLAPETDVWQVGKRDGFVSATSRSLNARYTPSAPFGGHRDP